jgi:Ser/Thr protein kinase RdoA (MazF antagonist)
MSAAAHRVHGMGTDLETPTWRPITPAEAASVLAAYPGTGRLERLDWHSPRPFSSATLAQTSTGRLFLKRHHRSLRDIAGLADEHAFIAHLAAHGVPVAEVLRSEDGASALATGEWTWEVHREAGGSDLYRDRPSWTPFLDLDHARAAGAALARLHLAAAGFTAPARPALPLVTSLTILTAADPILGAEAYVSARPALAAYLADKDWRAALGRLFDRLEAGRLPPALGAEPAIWTHNDWHPSNLTWTADGDVACVFDFGLSDRTCALHDLATALERSAVRWLELGQGNDATIGEPAAARAVLAGYAEVRPLGRHERRLLARLLPLVHVEFALAEADYFHGVVRRTADADLAWYGYLIGHAEWFLTAPGQALLAAVAAD